MSAKVPRKSRRKSDMEIKQARRAVRVAIAWGMVVLAGNLFSTLLLFFSGGRVPLNPGVHIPWNPFYQLGNTVLEAVLLFGLYKRNLWCPVISILNGIARTAYVILATGYFIFLPIIISIVLYVWAIQGIISLRREHTSTMAASSR
jgi:hypothetical protein